MIGFIIYIKKRGKSFIYIYYFSESLQMFSKLISHDNFKSNILLI